MRIIWSEPALTDLAAIHAYIARDSSHYAERFIQRLIAAVDPLREFPELGRVVPEGDGRQREVVVATYRIIYRVATDDVFIVAVIHGARDLAALWDRGEVG